MARRKTATTNRLLVPAHHPIIGGSEAPPRKVTTPSPPTAAVSVLNLPSSSHPYFMGGLEWCHSAWRFHHAGGTVSNIATHPEHTDTEVDRPGKGCNREAPMQCYLNPDTNSENHCRLNQRRRGRFVRHLLLTNYIRSHDVLANTVVLYFCGNTRKCSASSSIFENWSRISQDADKSSLRSSATNQSTHMWLSPWFNLYALGRRIVKADVVSTQLTTTHFPLDGSIASYVDILSRSPSALHNITARETELTVCRKSGRYSALTLYAMAGHRRNPSDGNATTGILIRHFTDLTSLKYSGVLDRLIDPLKQIPV
ncbi:hypothetical protein BC629DRAFT_1440861 [Irpex lacteus]|nr:hypothetical protein BC629DRAFT_1440861 [Irpex lacteus]